MKLPRWDRIYFFVFFSVVFAVIGLGAVLFLPMIESTSSIDGGPNVTTRKTLLEDGNTTVIWISLLPVILAVGLLFAVPRRGLPDRAAKINLWLSMFLFYVFVVISIWSIGILFVPAAILITAAAVGAQVTRRTSKVLSHVPEESKSGRGGGKRRRKKG